MHRHADAPISDSKRGHFMSFPSCIRTMLLLLSLAVLTGCGLKGDLYLSDPSTEDAPEMALPDDQESTE